MSFPKRKNVAYVDNHTISLYCQYQAGIPSDYWVTKDRKTLRTFKATPVNPKRAYEAAFEFFKRVVAGDDIDPAPLSHKERWLEEAAKIEQNRTKAWQEELTFSLLAALRHRSLVRTKKSENHANNPWVVDRALMQAGPIPKDPDEFYLWAERAADAAVKIARPQREDAKEAGTQNARRIRINTFISCLDVIAEIPAFKAWHKGHPVVKNRVEARRNELVSEGVEEKNRPALGKAELNSLFQSCITVNESLTVIAYLCLGTRAGNSENADYAHLQNGIYVLTKIQTKTEVDRRPAASLCLRAMLRLKKEANLELTPIPTGWDRRRFRPTVATMLNLCGVSELLIAIRCGLGTTRMIQEHYSVNTPSDYGGSKNVESYYGIKPVQVNGIMTSENAYDNFVLWCFLKQMERWGMLDLAKECIMLEMNQDSTEETLSIASF